MPPVHPPDPLDARTAALANLVARIARHARTDGVHDTAIEPLKLIRASTRPQPVPAVYEPGLAFVIQGRKQTQLGSDVIHYAQGDYLVIALTLPTVGQILEASPSRPYYCLRLNADPQALGDLLLKTGEPALPGGPGQSSPDGQRDAGHGLRVARTPERLLDALQRLLDLLDTPADTAVLAPLVLQEIYYRALTGDLGHLLREQVRRDSHTQRIGRAIELLKRRFAEPLRIEDVAAAVHMSESSLHAHFKQVTALSPLQFQKHLRLHHARRLMLMEGRDAASAGHEVGYESPSQFSREYRRLFGAPPRADIDQQRAASRVLVDSA